MSPAADVIIVGAGIAGLSAAEVLTGAGHSVIVLEKATGVGGRMATRRVGDAVCDHGAQFFTVRGRAFGKRVTAAHAAGVVRPWSNGFLRAASNGSEVLPAVDGHTRWCGSLGMRDFPKHIAAGLPADRCTIMCGTRAAAIGIDGGRVRTTIEGASHRFASQPLLCSLESIETTAAIVTCPVPQSLACMAAGGLLDRGGGIDGTAMRLLAGVSYDPCFALIVVLDKPSRVPAPGAIVFDSGPIAWIGDNQQKGISPVPALTVHASAAWSREHFDVPQDEVARLLLGAASAWIDGPLETSVIERSMQRWKYSQPTTIIPAPMVAATTQPPIVCCGDAFGGPRVEGAASSGVAAATWMLRVLKGQLTDRER